MNWSPFYGTPFRPGGLQHLSMFLIDLSMFISAWVCYTIYTVKGTKQETAHKEFQKKKIKKFLTNALDCAIIKMFQEEQKTK